MLVVVNPFFCKSIDYSLSPLFIFDKYVCQASFFLIVSFLPFLFFGQVDNEKGFEVKSKIGFLAIQHQSMSHLPKETAKAFEFSFVHQTRGNKLWHKAYRYPTIGATLFI